MNVIIYSRVSTDEQSEGTSLEYQENTIREYCVRKQYNIVGCYREDYSAKDFDHRPEMNRIMSYCKKNKNEVQLLLFLRWDRYSRNLEYALTNIRQMNAMDVCVNAIENSLDQDSPDYKTLLGVYIGNAEAGNIKRSKATKDGIHQSLEKGRCTNKAPRGYKNVKVSDYDKYVKIVPEVAEKIKDIFLRVSKGLESPNYIRKEYARNGLIINKNSFMAMLHNRFYIGEVRVPAYKEKLEHYVKGLHDGIIDPEVFWKVQEVIDGKKKNNPKLSKKTNPDLFLRKYIVCPICGYSMTGATSTGNGGKYTYYNCSHDASHIRCRAEVANKEFVKYVASLKPNNEIVELYKDILSDIKTEKDGDNKKKVELLKTELHKAKDRIANADERFLDNDIDKETHVRIVDKYQKEAITLQQQIELMLNPERSNLQPKLEYSMSLINNMDKYIEDAPVEVKCKIIGSMFPEKITFDYDNYRTDSYNVVLDLIYQETNKLRGKEKGENSNNLNLPTSVPRAGIEPAWK